MRYKRNGLRVGKQAGHLNMVSVYLIGHHGYYWIMI